MKKFLLGLLVGAALSAALTSAQSALPTVYNVAIQNTHSGNIDYLKCALITPDNVVAK